MFVAKGARTCWSILLSMAVSSVAASGQTITVDLALDDFEDFGGAKMVADLPGPDGHITFREAVTAANNTPGPQTIAFAIPLSQWSIWATDRAIIELELMLYVSGDDTTIDFTTQVDFTGNSNPNGNEVGLAYFGVPAYIPCLWLAGHRCTVKGLDVAFGNNFSQTIWITGNNNRVIGCTTNGLTIRGDYGGGDFNTVGGVEPGEGNTFSEGVGIYSAASNNVVVGNNFRWGLRINGDTYWGTCDNNRIGGPSVAERNNLAGYGYYAEEGFPSGTQLAVQHARNTLIENNYVGTTPDGSAKFPGRSGTGGIAIYTGAVDTVVRNNLVSGIEMTGTNHYNGQRFGTAISIGATASGTVLTGNRVGVAADGLTPLLNVVGFGVYSDPNGIPGNTRFGDTGANEGNLVANSERTGIQISNSAAGVRIWGNSVFDNGTLGIDLVGVTPSGVTPNDPGDADTGGNNLQNFPVLSSAQASGLTIHVVGTLNSTASMAYRIEFFVNSACDPSGYGEGEVFVGGIETNTNAEGNAAFDATFAAQVFEGDVVTATATRLASGDTSEFSACIAIEVDAQDTVPPFIMQGGSVGPTTSPFAGYIDPRIESDNGVDWNRGISSMTLVFNEPVRAIGGGELTAASLTIRQTGDDAPPAVASIDVQDGRVVTVTLDRPITPMEWTTVAAAVEDMNGNVIEDLGDQGPGVDEGDRVDIGFLPGDIDQSGIVNPLDLLKLKQYVNGVAVPVEGNLVDFVDLDRNGLVQPLDLLTFKRMMIGVGHATQAWAGQSLHHPRP